MKRILFLLLLTAVISGCGSQTLISRFDAELDRTGLSERSFAAQDEPEIKKAREIYVSVQGAVESPGIYVFNEGIRVYEVLNTAGLKEDIADIMGLDLVYIIDDDYTIYVPTKEESSGNEAGSGGGGQHGKVNINTADAATLTTLSGIGESKAKAIIEYREKNGKFEAISDITNVSGIGEGIFEKIRDSIAVR